MKILLINSPIRLDAKPSCIPYGLVTSAEPWILQRMAEVVCVWIDYGIESGSPKILNDMGKKAIVDTRKAGIYPNTTFIFGYPGETVESIQETIDFKRELGIECGSFFATPYPETPLYNQVQSQIKDEEGFIQSLGNATEFNINLTDFDNKTLFALKCAMDGNRDVLAYWTQINADAH